MNFFSKKYKFTHGIRPLKEGVIKIAATFGFALCKPFILVRLSPYGPTYHTKALRKFFLIFMNCILLDMFPNSQKDSLPTNQKHNKSFIYKQHVLDPCIVLLLIIPSKH